jgi:hypothetical protein
MFAWIGENIFYVCACLGCVAFVLVLVCKLSFKIRRVGKHEEEYYFPMEKRARICMVILSVAALAIFAASFTDSKSILGLIFLLIPMTNFYSNRLLYCIDGIYYYSSDEFCMNDIKIEKPKWVREGKYAVLIFKTITPKPRLVQFNVPLEDARFFEEN